jgi:hypothetical protein
MAPVQAESSRWAVIRNPSQEPTSRRWRVALMESILVDKI